MNVLSLYHSTFNFSCAARRKVKFLRVIAGIQNFESIAFENLQIVANFKYSFSSSLIKKLSPTEKIIYLRIPLVILLNIVFYLIKAKMI